MMKEFMIFCLMMQAKKKMEDSSIMFKMTSTILKMASSFPLISIKTCSVIKRKESNGYMDYSKKTWEVY